MEVMKLATAVSPPEANIPIKHPRRASPAAAAPMQYITNIALLANSTTLMVSWIADGHLRSVRFKPGLSSFCMMLVGSK